MKKLFIIFIAFFALALSACSPAAPVTFDIALVTDVGDIDDRSFNQGAWEGVVAFATERNISHQYFRPTGRSNEEVLAAIELAIDNGAKVIVTPGFLFAPVIYEAQDLFPDIKFILLDAIPNTGPPNFTVRIEDNVHSIFYAEEQAGFLAGYAAVREGFTSLGFMGGMAVPAVVRFGYGFVQGAEYAAVEMGVDVAIRYTYLGGFGPTPAFQTQAASWYTDGVEVIFAAAGGAGLSVMQAAEANNGKVIGVDIDQSFLSNSVITSALKELGPSVILALENFFDGTFKGGVSEVLDVTTGGVNLPDDFSRFSNFTRAQYDAIFAKLVANTDNVRTSILKNTDVTTPVDIPVTRVTLSFIE